MFSCLTNDEMLVCLKYCLTRLASVFHVVVNCDQHSRQDLRELGRWRHDEALVRVRPRDEVRNGLIFEHAVMSVSIDNFMLQHL